MNCPPSPNFILIRRRILRRLISSATTGLWGLRRIQLNVQFSYTARIRVQIFRDVYLSNYAPRNICQRNTLGVECRNRRVGHGKRDTFMGQVADVICAVIFIISEERIDV
jgi:hypothetical protein